MGDALKKTGQAVGTALLDVGTLGQSYQSRQAAKLQEQALAESRRLAAEQKAELERIGPAPTLQLPEEEQQDLRRRRRLMALQAGLASTVRSRPQNSSTTYSV